jgi:hypothetical protein
LRWPPPSPCRPSWAAEKVFSGPHEPSPDVRCGVPHSSRRSHHLETTRGLSRPTLRQPMSASTRRSGPDRSSRLAAVDANVLAAARAPNVGHANRRLGTDRRPPLSAVEVRRKLDARRTVRGRCSTGSLNKDPASSTAHPTR